MSQDKIQRRRFLADILFAGGALSAAALAAKAWNQPKVSPLPTSTPLAQGTPLVQSTPCVTNQTLSPNNHTMLSGEVAPPIHPAGAPMPPKMQTPQFEKPASNP